jgi:negative regulator of flagellin synthesis FlgM
MKIGNRTPGAMPNTDGAAKSSKASGPESILDTKKTKSAASAEELADSARVDLSARAQDIKKAKELATPEDGVDEAKVARLQALIDGGKYKVDAEAIADRLLDEHSKMPL